MLRVLVVCFYASYVCSCSPMQRYIDFVPPYTTLYRYKIGRDFVINLKNIFMHFRRHFAHSTFNSVCTKCNAQMLIRTFKGLTKRAHYLLGRYMRDASIGGNQKVGAMGGGASTGKSLFLLGDGMQITLALTAAALPSNAAFQKSLSLIPKGMREFASWIRAADLAESGFCMDVMPMRPLLAHALGIKEEDLAGCRAQEELLLNLIKAGA